MDTTPLDETPQQLEIDSIITYYTTMSNFGPTKGRGGGGTGQPDPTYHGLLPSDLRVNPDSNYSYVSGDLRGYNDSWASSSVLGQSLGPLLPREKPPESLVLRPRMEKVRAG
jgi:hypothetical protein